MRNRVHFLFLVCSLFIGSKISAQIVGTDCFLQGKYVEVGINQMGGFGTCTSPATYHPHVCCGTATAFTPGGNLDAVYDWGHDGWSVGAPQLMGDYSIPGFPQEGWSVQVGATEYRNGAWGGICTGAYAIPGTHSSYTNVSGSAIETWTGNIAGLNIRAQTRLDTMASWVVVTAVLRNTTAAPIAGVYYQRTLDPDNTSFWSGTPVTQNLILHQNEDARHKVMVSAHGKTPASGSTPMYDSINSYLALATKDCRARGVVIGGLAPSTTPSMLWSFSGGVTLSALNATNYADQGISLVYNLGTIPAGDSTIISYAYIYMHGARTSIDSAFPDPAIVLMGIPMPVVPVPYPNNDTFDMCLYPGTTTLPVDLMHVEDKNWSWSKWTWTPALGLSATTGAHVTINTTVLPSSFTYTITGTDSASGMNSCLNKTFYLTILTCNGATANSPCEGDTLWLNAPGDSTAAAYQWYGPSPSTSIFATTQKTFIYPATMAHNGSYHVIKTVGGGAPDTADVIVTVHPTPSITVGSNAPMCVGSTNTLSLTCTPDPNITTYSWSANPSSFTSTLANPTIVGFSEADTGVYKLVVSTAHGCMDSGTVDVRVVLPAPPPIVTAATPYCKGNLFTPFTTSGIAPGYSVVWYPVGSGGTGSGTAPTVNTAVPGVYTFWFTQKWGSCESPRDSVIVTVHPEPGTNFTFERFPGCPNDSVVFTNTTTGGATWMWQFGDGLSSTEKDPVHIYTKGHKTYTVTLTATNTFGCFKSEDTTVDLNHTVKAIFNFQDTLVCNGTAVQVNDLSVATKYGAAGTVATCDWDFGDPNDLTTVNTAAGASAFHTYPKEGFYVVKLTATDDIGCKDMVPHTIQIIQPYLTAVSDTTFCLPYKVSMPVETHVMTSPTEPKDTYKYEWSPAVGLSSTTVSAPLFSDTVGVFVYTVIATLKNEGCADTAYVTLRATKPTQLRHLTINTKIKFGNSIQLYCDSDYLYTWTPNDGSLDNPNINNPIATPSVTTTYTVYGMDKYGCRDTASVTIKVDSTAHEHIPSGFTPNGDGLNDVFRFTGGKHQKLLEMRVYNRYGELVFYSNTREVGWDGTYKGKPADLGVYYYTVILARPGYPENQVVKGEVTLIR